MHTIIHHPRWHWIYLAPSCPRKPAYVMDDFGNAVEITAAVTFISLRESNY